MASKTIYVILILLVSIPKEHLGKISYQIPKPSSLRGYVDYYHQNLSDFPLELDPIQLFTDAMNIYNSMGQTDPVTKFQATLAEPFIFAINDVNGFTVWGPLYSLVKEAVVHLNYTLDGICIEKQNTVNAAVKFNADVSLGPVFIHFKSVSTVIDDQNPVYQTMHSVGLEMRISRNLGVGEVDCIMFRKGIKKKPPFDFILVFDWQTTSLLLITLPLISVVMAGFRSNQIWDCLTHVIGLLFGICKQFECYFYSLFTLWVTVYWFFRTLFGGDMFSCMTTPPRLDVIDSWQDLSDRPYLKILATADFADMDASSFGVSGFEFAGRGRYFGKTSPFYDDFTSRLKVESFFELAQTENYEMPDGEILYSSEFNGSTVLMAICEGLRYRLYNSFSGQLEKKLYVSRSGGDVLPYFIFTSAFAEAKEVAAINLM